MKKLKLIRDCMIKDFGKTKAKRKSSYKHKAGKRLYNDDTWKTYKLEV